MIKQHLNPRPVTYILFTAVFLSYLVFPEPYILVSQSLFRNIYSYTAPGNLSEQMIISNTHMIPLYTLARPPQTPYDIILSVMPQRAGEEDIVGHYVFTEDRIPVGYIREKEHSFYTLVLFSSPESDEVFSVNGYTAKAQGVGSGGFIINVPLEVDIEPQTPIIHQATGTAASTIVTLEVLSEKVFADCREVLQPIRCRHPYCMLIQPLKNDTWNRILLMLWRIWNNLRMILKQYHEPYSAKHADLFFPPVYYFIQSASAVSCTLRRSAVSPPHGNTDYRPFNGYFSGYFSFAG